MSTVSVDTRWFQNRLADRRISQRKLATVLNLDPSAVSLMLRGKRQMSAAEAAEVSRVLDVDVEEVLRHAGISMGMVAAVKGQRASAAGATATGERRRAEMADGELEIPVPLTDGGVARLVLPRGLRREDAERIAAMVTAFAVKG